METKRKYERAAPAGDPLPSVVAPERALRVVTRPERNPGTALDLDLVRALRVNRSAVERRAATIPTRRTVKKEWQAAWLLRAITCMDLTTLQGDDTPTNAFRAACGAAHMKVILGTGDLATLVTVARASMVAMMAGADFIKTSTGKEAVNATLPVGVVMTRMIRDYHECTGYAVGFKPAGGIRSAKTALHWLILMKEELGDRWLKAELFRLGASSLLTDIERQLEHFVTGRYSAA